MQISIAKLLQLTIAGFLCVPVVSSQEITPTAGRQRVNWNAGWNYLEADPGGVSEVLRAQGWTKVNLPHTWNAYDVVDQEPGYRRATSWYMKELVLPRLDSGQRVLLEFEGVNITTDVYVNGRTVGRHVGGYVGFSVDLTPHLIAGGKNSIAVRVDNSYDPDIIPSQKSDFCIYGGITRDVWLVVVPATSIRAMRISTPVVTERRAETAIDVDFVNVHSEKVGGELEVTVNDRKGTTVLRATQKVSIVPGKSTVTVKFPDLKNPLLWSPDQPNLYTVDVALVRRLPRLAALVRDEASTVDRITDRFGYRYYEFKDHGPFFLNGKRLLLRGTHRHEDWAGFGSAMPDSLHRKDIAMIKEIGANFVRLAHYPQDPEVYRACDELGILVWDELPWCRGGMGGDVWKSNTRRLLEEQMLVNFNHPSIIIQSLGNEMYWLPDFPGGDHLDSLRSMVRDLNEISHRINPSKITATRKFTEGADLVDVVSPSLWPGWYSGNYFGFEKAIIDSRDKFAKFFHAEYGGDSHVGRHTDSPVTGDATSVPDGWEENIKPQKVKNVSLSSDWSESYITDLFDWYLHISERAEWFSGNAQWAFKDFPTPLRPENPIPYVNQKGLLDREGNPKDAYYVFKSYWTKSPLFAYIESHTWTERSGPKGISRSVNVFSNCAEVELFHNGVSLGRKSKDISQFPANGLHWDVMFTDGMNVLRAVGRNVGSEVPVDSATIQYSYRRNDEADRIQLSGLTRPDGAVLVTATAVDKNGRRCLDYNKRVYFSLDGGGRLEVNRGTPKGSSVIEMANGRAAIVFWPNPSKRAVIEARNQDFKGAYLVFPPALE